jgi:hypothetical protein
MTVLLLSGTYYTSHEEMWEADGRQMEMLNIFMGVCLLSDEVGWEADGSTNKLIDMRSIPQKVTSLDCSFCPLGEGRMEADV